MEKMVGRRRFKLYNVTLTINVLHDNMQIRECFAKLMMLKSLFGWASTNCVTTEYNETGNDIMLPTISYYWKWPLALKCSCYGVKNVFKVTRKYYNGINFWPLNRFLLTKVVIWYRQKHYQLNIQQHIIQHICPSWCPWNDWIQTVNKYGKNVNVVMRYSSLPIEKT